MARKANKSTRDLIDDDELHAKDAEKDKNETASAADESLMDKFKRKLGISNRDSIFPQNISIGHMGSTAKYHRENMLYQYFENYRHNRKIRNMAEHRKQISALVEQGADVNFIDRDGDNVLLEICRLTDSASVELFKIMLEYGVRIVPNSHGQTVLHLACYFDNTPLVRFILNDLKLTDLVETRTYEESQTPLHYAAKNGSVQSVISLIRDYGANKEAKDHQGRTPLYVAAEHGQRNTLRSLIDLGCTERVTNKEGQKALFWIIAKSPELASELMDKYRKCDKYARVDKYFLWNVDIELFPDGTVPEAKSILALLVENQNLELLIHPVIYNLVKKKWKDIARNRSLIDLLLTIVNIIVWNILGDLISYDQRHIYNFPVDWWRIFLFIIGILGMCSLLVIEFFEVSSHSIYIEKVKNQRRRELLSDYRLCHAKDKTQQAFLKEELNMSRRTTAFKLYISDFWNWFDFISIVLLAACTATHIADILNHSETLARAHIRLMSVTVVFIALRLLKVGRLINEDFGILVMTLYFVVKDVFVWILAYIVFWIPFTSAFFMLFANREICSDGECTSSGSLPFLQGYNTIAFGLYLTTFGTDFDLDSLRKIDPIMTNILVGFYIGMTTLLLVNIFIALLTSTFTRVHDSSKAYFVLQRAIEIINRENHSVFSRKRPEHLRELQKDYVDNKYSVTSELPTSLSETMEPVKDTMRDIREEIVSLYEKLESLENEITENFAKLKNVNIVAKKPLLSQSKSQPPIVDDNKQHLIKLEQDFAEIKALLSMYFEQQKQEDKQKVLSQKGKPKVDVLQIAEIIPPIDPSNVRLKTSTSKDANITNSEEENLNRRK